MQQVFCKAVKKACFCTCVFVIGETNKPSVLNKILNLPLLNLEFYQMKLVRVMQVLFYHVESKLKCFWHLAKQFFSFWS